MSIAESEWLYKAAYTGEELEKEEKLDMFYHFIAILIIIIIFGLIWSPK